jgi:peroxiredoxin
VTFTVAPACRGEPFWKAAIRLAAVAAVAVAPFLSSPVKSELAKSEPTKSEPTKSDDAPSAAERAAFKVVLEPRPGFVLRAVGGSDVTLEAQRGRTVLLHFFATWCEPCREELPALGRLAVRGERDGVTVLAISVAEVLPRVQRFLEATPVNFPVLLDADRAVTKAWKISTLPSTVILDTDLVPRLLVEQDVAWDKFATTDLLAMMHASRQLNQTITERRE